MISVQQGEKQLFEKFWRGTFKAVATPRPESIIVASIRARRSLNNGASNYQAHRSNERSTSAMLQAASANGCSKVKDSKQQNHHRQHRSCSGHSPPPASKRKKKKKKSEHKRRRSPSCSPAPVRKKKKKSSKKHKRNRSAAASAKKRRHSSKSPKRKRKDEKRHRKRSRAVSTSHKGHRCRRPTSHVSAARTSSCSSSNEGRSKAARCPRGRSRSSNHGDYSKSNPGQRAPGTSHSHSGKSPCKSPQNKNSRPTSKIIYKSESSGRKLVKEEYSKPDNVPSQNGTYHDYDSGNDTASSPSTKPPSSRSQTEGEKGQILNHHAELGSQTPSPGKLKLGDAEPGSDSGNSVTSCSSPCKVVASSPTTSPAYQLDKGARRELSASHGWPTTSERKTSPSPSPARNSPRRHRSRSDSQSSRERERSSHSYSCSSRSRSSEYKSSMKYSRSRSHSSGKRSSSRSLSYSPRSRRSPGSRSSRSRRSPSYSRYSPERDHDRGRDGKKYGSRERESRRRRSRSYSPMRKRRRDSPSHLEPRRITSARKRPIPYYRPSPSSSSSVSSYSSRYSSRSHSRSWSRSRTTSRSRSYSSRSRSRSRSRNRSRSRSRSSDRGSSGRSRSKSYDSDGSYESLRR
ncbi:serine/arginine repetitive matrix protein 4 isoform X1 [Amblyraja radiata]|uniref:serine/arginine repetitive matrix protein 4 isoform X1 n=1 Tax=Amblyraja radiata TaxID=386614 RepID=UPI0014022794|nr:serine/arginine repetitive matrix protein 4 isoform X1 [Amblyraja radiata]